MVTVTAGSTIQLQLFGLVGAAVLSPDYTLIAAAGATGATGATGAGLSGIVPFDPALAPTYPAGQIVTFGGSTYITNVASPTGTPGTSPDYTLIAGAGATGVTGATGVGVTGSTGETGHDARLQRSASGRHGNLTRRERRTDPGHS